MKRFLFLTVMVLAFILKVGAQENETIFTINDGSIITNNDFIEPLFNDLEQSLDYSLNENCPSVSVGEVKYDVKVGSYTSMDYPGDFDVVEISKNGVQQCFYREDAGIVKRNRKFECWYYPMKGASRDFARSATNDYYMEFSLSPTTKALFFFGQKYGTDVGKTLIFILTKKEVKLVFSKTMEVVDLDQSASKLNFLLWSTYMEFDLDGTVLFQPDVHTIWREGGVLKFKNGK